MTNEKWQEVRALLESKFIIEEHGEEDLNPGRAEFYVFTGPFGKMKLERVTRPKRQDQAGEQEYSSEEDVSFMKGYRWNEDVAAWSNIDLSDLLN